MFCSSSAVHPNVAATCHPNLPLHTQGRCELKKADVMDQCCVNSEAHVVREGAGWAVCRSDIRMRSRRGAKHTAQLAPSLTTATTNEHKQATIHKHNNNND
jgi:hypothetical protein